MMSSWKLLVAAVQIISAVARYLQRRSLISEGEQRQLAKSLAAIARSGNVADRVRHESEALTSEQLDEDLMK